MVELAKQLILTKERERGGRIARDRFDFQALWGITLLLTRHETEQNYAIAFEFHDDVALLDDDVNPTSIDFYQVKTKAPGNWTGPALLKRPAGLGGELGDSHAGKMCANISAFPEHTSRVVFVTNAYCNFVENHVNECRFSECAKIGNFFDTLKLECQELEDEQTKLFWYVRSDLSLGQPESHTKGLLLEFLTKNFGSLVDRVDAVFQILTDECKRRSRWTQPPTTLRDIIENKCITRSDFSGWLASMEASHPVPAWDDFATDLHVDAVSKIALRREWRVYRSEALNPGNEVVRRLRSVIAEALKSLHLDGLSLADSMEHVRAHIDPQAQKIAPTTLVRLQTMILFEMHADE